MSLFAGILGNVVGSVFGSNPRGSQRNALGAILNERGDGTPFRSGMLLHAALRLVQQNGGLDGMLEQFRQKGLGAHADSWLGPGPNLHITPEQLHEVLGATSLDRAAAPLDLSAAEAGSAMAEILPVLVDQLTPEGRVPEKHQDLITKGIAMLGNAGA